MSARTAATATASATGTAATATASPCAGSATLRTAGAGGLTGIHRRGSIIAVEVGLVFLVDFSGLVVKVVSALDQDRALVGGRLALVELVTRTARSARLPRQRNRRLAGRNLDGVGVGRCLLRHLGLLLADERLAAELDAVAFDGQHLHHHLVAFAQFVLHFLHTMLGDL